MESICEYCSKKFNRKPSHLIKYKHNFCSRICKSNSQIGGIPWNKGKKGVQKNPRKGKSNIQIYGLKKAKYLSELNRQAHLGKKQSKESILKRSLTYKQLGHSIGEKNPMYTTGVSYMENKLKKEVIRCERCDILFSEFPSTRYIQIHHIDKDRTNNNRENLAVLCSQCHMDIHVELHDRRNKYSVKNER